MKFLAVILSAVLLSPLFSAQAQTLYVNDQFKLGLHTHPILTSTISALIPSGAKLEQIERNNGLIKVRTESGTEGWIDAKFTTETEPGGANVNAFKQELAGAQAALADAQAKIVALEQNTPATAETNGDPNAISSDALREMQQLAEENQRLKQQIAEQEAVQRMSQEQAVEVSVQTPLAISAPPRKGPNTELLEIFNFATINRWHVLLFPSVLLLAFATGGWLVDWRSRRRHGGFRV